MFGEQEILVKHKLLEVKNNVFFQVYELVRGKKIIIFFQNLGV